ncbi:MAG: hypothetical protein ABIA04_10760 [Pseudomonadota bacterium]
MLRILSVIFLICFSLCTCTNKNKDIKKEIISIELLSLAYNYDVSGLLTYSALSVINDTSAHLFSLEKDLTIRGNLAKHYLVNDTYTKYKILLDKKYLSLRGDSLTSEDVVFSFTYLCKYSSYIRGLLSSVKGVSSCKKEKCEIGIREVDQYQVEFELDSPDPNFIKKLSSPFFIIFKKGKSYYEKIGKCKIPYQTGLGNLADCKDGFLQVVFKEKVVNIYDSQAKFDLRTKFDGKLLDENPGKTFSPSLIVLSLAANPKSNLSREVRLAVLDSATRSRAILSEMIKLKVSYTFVSEWFMAKKYKIKKHNQKLPYIDKKLCPSRPMKFIIDKSLPERNNLRKWLKQLSPCEIEIIEYQTERVVYEYADSDFGFLWVTPDYLDYYNIYSIFDCEENICFFNWQDNQLQTLLNKIKSADLSEEKKALISQNIEEHLINNGYVAPLLQLNTWMKINNAILPVHPAGLAQLKISDFIL